MGEVWFRRFRGVFDPASRLALRAWQLQPKYPFPLRDRGWLHHISCTLVSLGRKREFPDVG